MLAWKRGDLAAAAERLMAAFGIALVAAGVSAFLMGATNILALLGVALAAWLMAGALSETAFRIRLGQIPLADSYHRFVGLPRSALGMTLAHFGLGVTLLGIVATTAWSSEDILTMKPGDSVAVGGYQVTLEGFIPRAGPNYQETAVRFAVRDGGVTVRTMEAAKRNFAARATSTTEAAIATFWPSQLYISLGDIATDGATTVRLYWKSLATLIWLGAIVMALGGVLSLSDRRLRVGAPRPARKVAVAPAE
jgi:cytochrome c-type biogenesis protein CcmF